MPESGTYQLPPKSPKWESGLDGRYQAVYLPVTILGTGKISWSIWPTEKAGRAVGRDSQIFACQLARSKSAESAALCPSDMMLCVISYWVLSGAKWRQIQQLRCCVLPRQAVETEGCLCHPDELVERAHRKRVTDAASAQNEHLVKRNASAK